MHRVDSLPDLLGDDGPLASAAQPVPVDAPGDPGPAALPGPPGQGPFADPAQPQHRGRVGAQGGHLGDLGHPPLMQRGDRRIIARPRLAGQRVQRAAAAVAGLGLHQVRVARGDQLPLPGGEILQPGRLPSPAIRQARDGGRGGQAVAAIDQRPDRGGQLLPVVAAQQYPAGVRFKLAHLPPCACQHQPAARRQFHRPAARAVHSPLRAAPRQTRALSPNGTARSMARTRCQIR